MLVRGTIEAIRDDGIKLRENGWLNFSKRADLTGIDQLALGATAEFVTEKNSKPDRPDWLLGLAPAPAPAAQASSKPPPSAAAASCSDRDYLMARMSALKSAARVAAADPSGAEELFLADKYLAWLLAPRP